MILIKAEKGKSLNCIWASKNSLDNKLSKLLSRLVSSNKLTRQAFDLNVEEMYKWPKALGEHLQIIIFGDLKASWNASVSRRISGILMKLPQLILWFNTGMLIIKILVVCKK